MTLLEVAEAGDIAIDGQVATVSDLSTCLPVWLVLAQLDGNPDIEIRELENYFLSLTIPKFEINELMN